MSALSRRAVLRATAASAALAAPSTALATLPAGAEPDVLDAAGYPDLTPANAAAYVVKFSREGAEHMSRGSFKVAWLLLDYASEIARRMDTGEDVGGLMRGEWEP